MSLGSDTLSGADAAILAAIASVCPPPDSRDETTGFWRAGLSGKLAILRCGGCGYWIHPPSPVCPECLSRDVVLTAVSGHGTVVSYTVNHQPWYPGLPARYTIAIVELAEQVGLRLVTNLVGLSGEPAIGDPVQVEFWLRSPEIALPVFRPQTP